MEDDRKLCEYSLPEGAVISALFEPNVDITVEVKGHQQTKKLTLSNATSIKVLKAQISGVMKCDVAPEKLELKFDEATLEDPMPLHFYGIQEASKLEVFKPYVNVTIENNKGNEIYWRLYRKDTIAEVKVKLPMKSMGTEELDDDAKVEQLRLYLVSDGQKFDELDGNKTVEDSKIKEDDILYLLSYVWTQKLQVKVKKTGRNLRGCEGDDKCLGIKVKAQDQVGMPVSTTRLVRSVDNQWGENPIGRPTYPGYGRPNDYVRKYQQLIEISDEENPFKYKEPLSLVTEEELEADRVRVEEEEKAWREEVRKEHFRADKRNRLEERKKLGYVHGSIYN